MYQKLVPVKQEILVAFLTMLDKGHKNPLQCFVTWDGVHSTIALIDEPPGTRMYINGEWVVQDADRMTYEVFVASEDLRENSPSAPPLQVVVSSILEAQVQYFWDIRVKEFERIAKVMAAAFDIDLSEAEFETIHG